VKTGTPGEAVLVVEVDPAVPDGAWEIVEAGGRYREWCVPAHVLNTRATISRYESWERRVGWA
jgi:hypothetical protein